MSKDQINLPKTAFSMKANLPIREPEILELWKKIDLYKELRSSRKGEEKFVLHEAASKATICVHTEHESSTPASPSTVVCGA